MTEVKKKGEGGKNERRTIRAEEGKKRSVLFWPHSTVTVFIEALRWSLEYLAIPVIVLTGSVALSTRRIRERERVRNALISTQGRVRKRSRSSLTLWYQKYKRECVCSLIEKIRHIVLIVEDATNTLLKSRCGHQLSTAVCAQSVLSEHISVV
jgi:hypothetical protein